MRKFTIAIFAALIITIGASAPSLAAQSPSKTVIHVKKGSAFKVNVYENNNCTGKRTVLGIGKSKQGVNSYRVDAYTQAQRHYLSGWGGKTQHVNNRCVGANRGVDRIHVHVFHRRG